MNWYGKELIYNAINAAGDLGDPPVILSVNDKKQIVVSGPDDYEVYMLIPVRKVKRTLATEGVPPAAEGPHD